MARGIVLSLCGPLRAVSWCNCPSYGWRSHGREGCRVLRLQAAESMRQIDMYDDIDDIAAGLYYRQGRA
jgi:hypothetical protein